MSAAPRGPGALRASAVIVAAVALVSPALAGCAASIPVPRSGDHDGDERVLVPFPPPPPKVEIVPPAPKVSSDEVWVDGQWLWRGQRWEWHEGGWETPAPGATYAAPQILYLPDKQIAWLPGRWRAPARR